MVTISLAVKGVRPLLLLLLAGRAQCYPSSFLSWPLPLILILLSVSVQSFKGAESLSTSHTLSDRYGTQAKDPAKVPLSHVPHLPCHSYGHKFMPAACVGRKEWDCCHEQSITIFFPLAAKSYGVQVSPCTCLLIHGTYSVILFDYFASK